MRNRGTIEKRGKSYRVRMELGRLDDGRRDVIRRTFPTKREAERFLAELVIENDADGHEGRYFTVSQTIGAWFTATTHAGTSRYDYELVEKMIPESFLDRPIGRLRAADFARLYDELRRTGRSEWRLLKLHEMLRGALGLAVRYEWIPSNPATRATPPKPRKKTRNPPEVDEARTLIAAADAELRLWLGLAATTGARRGEIAGLRWADLDFEKNTVWIRRAVSYSPKTGVVIGPTKTDRERRLAIPVPVAEFAQVIRAEQQERATRIGDTWDPDRYLIGSDPVGRTPWRPDRATRVFGRLRDELELTEVRMKELRHFVATQGLALGYDMRTVSGRLGHAQTSTTVDLYAAWVPAVDRKFADELGSMVL
jgi:integrase